ncbi:MAG TPA: hypothetical protein VGT02_16005 [Methylomirabilota bacterium]|jgi:hypothetical protein|nr:hypothetical protein [Methylomirabilota bacterium]
MTALVLTVLTALFFGRVAGQALVAFAGVTWLPPMDAWFSGYLPYPVLLPIQVLILGVMATIDWQVWRRAGFFARSRPRAGRVLRAVSYVYALGMVVRFVLTGGLHVIPIVFHWVLAAYLFTLGRWYARPGAEPLSAAEAPTATGPRPASARGDLARPPRSG